MSKEAEFIVYVLEEYRDAKGISGKEALDLFDEYGVYDYLEKCYGALHVTGSRYIIDDVDSFIDEKKKS